MDRKRKRELRDLNSRAWDGDTDALNVSGSLDSSLKKNTAFIKRIRTGLSAASLSTFISEIRTLSLHKYLSEIISAAYEGLCKLKAPADVFAGVEIISALHQRFGPAEFTRQLGWLLGRGLSTPDKAQLKALSQDAREREEKERLARHRVLLRVVTELWLVNVVRSLDDVERPEDAGVKGKEGTQTSSGRGDLTAKSKPAYSQKGDADPEPFPLEVLKDLLGHDREHANLPLAVLFVKSFSFDILGVKGAAEGGRKAVEADGNTTEAEAPNGGSEDVEAPTALDQPLIDERLQNRFKNILIRYIEDVKAHVVRDQKSLSNQSRRNAEAYVKSGEIFEDRQANFEKQSKAHEKLVANTQVLCDTLGIDMPDLAEKEASDTATANSIGLVKAGEYLKGQGDGAGIWEDEDERRFYENLVDLRGRVPSILLEDSKKKKPDGDDSITRKEAGAEGEETQMAANAEGPKTTATESATEAADDQSTSIVNKTVGAQVDALLVHLPELQTKDMVDDMALQFCFLNSKASRNRLVKALQDIPKGRSDLLPLYSRLIATLGQYMPDVVQGLISYLDDEFRSLQRRKSKDFLGQVRTTNVRYLAELTKFGVVPEHVIFHCFKVSLDDFSRMNIEIIGNLLENCGRYLLRNPETSPRMVSFLETLNRKKSAQHLGAQERMLIENAMYYVDPPQRSGIEQKERTPTDSYIRQLIYLDMNKRNYTKILKSIRKLHWEEPEVVSVLERVFSKPGKVKYSNVHLLAVLLGALNRYHQEFVIGIVDNVLENVTLGLEQNDFKFNQRRIAEVKYLGELYNYKMLDSTVIFDLLYRIVTFGHEGGTPQPGNSNPFDLPDDFFRIRLVCTMLDTCGICFDRGHSKKKLDFFLTFFQYYLLTKDPVPMDIDFIVQDTYALVRPSWKLVTDLSEAAGIFAEACAANYQAQDQNISGDVAEEDAESSGEDDMNDDAIPNVLDDEGSSSEELEVNDEETEQVSGPDWEDEQIFVTRKEEQIDPEEEADFDRAFQSMMAESLDSRKFERRTAFDIPLPMRPVQRQLPHDEEVEEKPEAEKPVNMMAFSLMTKKGNRQQTRTIELPSDSHFAVAAKHQREAEREEQQRIKNLVLNYDLRDGNDQDGLERHNASHLRDKAGTNRSSHRARKLQLSDVDWT